MPKIYGVGAPNAIGQGGQRKAVANPHEARQAASQPTNAPTKPGPVPAENTPQHVEQQAAPASGPPFVLLKSNKITINIKNFKTINILFVLFFFSLFLFFLNKLKIILKNLRKVHPLFIRL